MEKTTNYQLNQWDANDKVQRVDFNADNQKIDTALKTNANAIAAEVSDRAAAVQAARDACPLVVLRTVTLTQDVARYSLDLTGFDWDAYGEVIIYMLLKNASNNISLTVLLNDTSSQGFYYGGSTYQDALFTMNTYAQGESVCCKVPRGHRFRSLWTTEMTWGAPQKCYVDKENFPNSHYTTMDLICGDKDHPLGAGSRLTILGVRG